MITTKSGATVVAGGLLTAGLAYLFTRHQTSRRAQRSEESGPRKSQELWPAAREESGPRTSEQKLRLHEISSLVGDHALAPDRAAMGEPLADPEIVELPIGQSADASYAGQLRQDKWPQPYTSGAVLKPPGESAQNAFVESLDAEPPLEAEFDDDLQDFDGGVSARPAAHPYDADEEFDAMSPDDLGARFLARATQAPRFEEEPELEISVAPWEFSSPNSDRLSEDAAAALSEASVRASGLFNTRELREAEETDPPSIPIDVEVPSEVWDAPASEKRR